MITKSESQNRYNLRVSNGFKEDYSIDINTDKINEYDIEESNPNICIYAKKKIYSYQIKIDKTQDLNHPELKPEYIKQINILILRERGEIIK